ncbi:sensor histidine kinase [Streptacidiphilus fuscans]|uniref:Histidine kinase n=1 Tax=Streptacidiphilus fuscans TaxID=2789292 RepID=A0A931B3A1_9ACTN|nr:ATP-binding protein [Streptacidiphilus fuscans]MBF9067163.1 histidine kinase [Streptacidiphilus fuscans]
MADLTASGSASNSGGNSTSDSAGRPPTTSAGRPAGSALTSPRHGGRRLGRAVVACAVSLGACFVWLSLAFTDLGGSRLDGLDFGPFGSRMLFMLVCALAGTFTFVHPSGGAVGRLLLVAATGELVGHAASIAGAALGAGHAVRTVVVLAGLVGDALYVFMLYALPFWLPDGTLPGRRWGRAVVGAIGVWTFGEVWLDTATRDEWYGMSNPLATDRPWTSVTHALQPVLSTPIGFVPVAVSALGFVVLAVRAWLLTRRGTGRQAMPGSVLLVMTVPFLLLMAGSYADYFFPVQGDAALVLFYGPLALWPLGLIVLFARDRSAHLDRATRRVLAALVVLAVLVVGYFALAIGLSDVLPGTRTPGALVLAVGSLTIGLLLRATGGWAVRGVDRSYYGDRARPYHVVRELAGRLSRTVTPGEAPRLLCASVVETLRFPAARVLVRTSGGNRETAALGEAVGPVWHRFELVFEGDAVGELEVAARESEPDLDQQDHDVLRLLADQSAPAIASLGLYEELQASRERIVLAREEARRRLRRDLHDGLAPTLSGLRLQVDTARAGLPDEDAAGRRLGGVSEGIADAIVELRRITAGLSPVALDREGLGAGLRQLATGLAGRQLLIEVELRPDPLPELPAAVEVALYRIAAEALHNVVRHADAARAWLRLCVADGAARLEVGDDGTGMDPVPAGRAGTSRHGGGVGLRSMAERAEELGGSLRVGAPEADAGATGVVVRAEIPLRSAC